MTRSKDSPPRRAALAGVAAAAWLSLAGCAREREHHVARASDRVAAVEAAALPPPPAFASPTIEAHVHRDPRGAINHLFALPIERATPQVLPAYRALATSAPHLIAESILVLVPDPVGRERIIEELLRTVLEHDFDAGLRLLPHAVDPAVRAGALRDIACAFAETSLPDAIAWLREFPPGLERLAVANGLLASWATHDLPMALAWFQRLPDDERPHLLPHLFIPLVDQAPAQAARTLHEAGLDFFEANLPRLLRTWVERDPAAAATWVSSLDPRRQRSAGHVLVRELLNAAPETALGWIHALPAESTLRATAIIARYENLRHENPAAAIAWVTEMNDSTHPEHRGRITATFERWLEMDRAAALAWLRTTSVRNAPSVAALLNSLPHW